MLQVIQEELSPRARRLQQLERAIRQWAEFHYGLVCQDLETMDLAEMVEANVSVFVLKVLQKERE